MNKRRLVLLSFLQLAALVFLAVNAAAFKINPELYDQNVDYSGVRLHYMDENGFREYHDQNVSFWYKAEMFLPEDGHLFGLSPLNPVAEVRVTLKNIKGRFQMTRAHKWEGFEPFGDDVVQDVNNLVISTRLGIISFLGNVMASPPAVIERMNSNFIPFSTITVYVPKTRKILDVYKAPRTFRLADHTYLFVSYTYVGIIYVNETVKLLIHIGLSLLVLLLVATILRFYDRIPRFNFRSKHLLLIVLLSLALMVQLAFIAPNPGSIVYKTKNGVFTYGGSSVQHYLKFITGLTGSVDALILDDDLWCVNYDYRTDRNLYLLTQSAERVYMTESIVKAGKPCVTESLSFFGKKLRVVPDAEELLHQAQARYRLNYPWKAFWGVNRRLIYLLFLAVSFFSMGFLITKAFEVSKAWEWLLFAVTGFLFAAVIQFLNLTTGFMAGLPVTYHGTSSLPLTMSAKIVSFFSQAHNIRMLILILGGLFVFIFNNTIRAKVSIRVFLLPVLVLGLMLAAPLTEYSSKSFLLAFACGECGFAYKGKLMAFDAVKIYAAMRSNTEVAALASFDDVDSYNLGKLLIDQQRIEEAVEVFEEYVASYPDSPNYVEVLKTLAGLYGQLYRYEENERYLVLAMANTPKEAERVELARQVHGMYVGKNRMGEAAELMEQQLERVTEEKSKPPLLLLLAQDYVALGRHAEAREVLHRVLENVETSPSNVEKARDLLGQLKQERET
ncbi:MAG: tetratricopeptide repeat protein [Candidatus Diapherotrites archaeon]|uniref:Tetratricopeptide repeat protein n=1 Tax=Candidatus Iainarchaeum sp. TaxID=3101447 RepID=A0A8T4LHN4_9ARCH|nr:tetratricopeptide repeat protein [Candidatus Diapherotrites archaeon]